MTEPDRNHGEQSEVMSLGVRRPRSTGLLGMLFSFKGRLNRKPYFVINLIANLLIALLFYVLSFIVFSNEEAVRQYAENNTFLVLFSIVIIINLVIVFFIITISVDVRRCHDFNISGWWVLFVYICVVSFDVCGSMFDGLVGGIFIGLCWLSFALATIYCLFVRGTNGPNRFGEDPLQR